MVFKILPAILLFVSAAAWAGPNPKAALNAELCQAVEKGDLDAANAALSKGAFIDAYTKYKYNDNTTPLMIAADRGDVKMVKFLMGGNVKKDHATVNATDEYGRTPLIMATRKGNVEIVKLLLAVMQNDPRGPAGGINKRDTMNRTALTWAKQLQYGFPTMKEIIKLLLDAGAKE